jgi:hypothetical protein
MNNDLTLKNLQRELAHAELDRDRMIKRLWEQQEDINDLKLMIVNLEKTNEKDD